MDNPGLPEGLWQQLDGRLWHATCLTGLSGILAEGQIRLYGTRYAKSAARKVEAVSLFDFGPTSDSAPSLPMFDNWNAWFGSHQACRVTAWLEIDRSRVAERLWDAGSVRRWWKEEGENRKFFAGVEAFHIGPVPIADVTGCLLVDGDRRSTFARLSAESSASWLIDADKFEAQLAPPPPPPVIEIPEGLAERLEEARARVLAYRLSELENNE